MKLAPKPKKFAMAASEWTAKWNHLDDRGEVEVQGFYNKMPSSWLDEKACRKFASFLLRAAEWMADKKGAK